MFKNTLLIDDDSNTLYLHRHFLNHYNFFNNLIEFQDANEALKSLSSSYSKDENLILLDLNMPLMSGWEFIDKLTTVISDEQLKRTTVIIVSSSNNPKDISKANAHQNIFAFIEKPFLPDDIEELIGRLKSEKLNYNSSPAVLGIAS